jgi:signal transduction histidine kinase
VPRAVVTVIEPPLRALRSLQWQLAVSYAAMAALLCLSISLVLMQVLGRVLANEDRAEVQSRAAFVADLVYHELSQQPPPLTMVLDQASDYARARVCAYDATGVLEACSVSGLSIQLTITPAPSMTDGIRSPRTPIAPFSDIMAGKTTSVFGYVQLDDPLTYRHTTLAEIQATVFKLSLLATAVAAGAGLLLGRGLTAPLRALTEAARRLGTGNLNARAPEEGDDEIGELGAGFNRMAARLQESFETLESERDALRTFVADMSHELRTPITALRTFNDLLSQGAVADEAVRDEFLAESGAQIERLEWLAQNLLDLSKFDAGIADVRMQRMDLRPLVSRAVDEARMAGNRKGISVHFDPPPLPVEASADPQRLEQALSNILGNSVKFTPSGGEVFVQLARVNDHTEISIRDTGPGIPPEELPHVFERFYRGPSTATLVAGSGLGLPIVQSIMQAHGGDVEVHSEPGNGTEVVLTLPAL